MIRLDGITKKYAEKAIVDVTLDVLPGVRYAIMGDNGVGKTTILQMLARILRQDTGEISEKSGLRRALVLQDFPLFPWRTVDENIGISLEIDSEGLCRSSIPELLRRSGLQSAGDLFPGALSGGMRQKASILQAVVHRPNLFLLDEPFSALDFLSKIAMQRILISQLRAGDSLVLATHDIEDAVSIADRILIMTGRPGRITNVVECDLIETDVLARRKSAIFREKVDEVMGKLGW